MDITEAAAFINGLALKPGWTIDARPAGYTSVYTVVTFPTWNSAEAYAPGYEADPFTRPVARTIGITPQMTRADITAAVVKLCLETEMHEWAEFTRYYDQGRWVAPLHPHQDQGMRALLAGKAVPTPAGCLAG